MHALILGLIFLIPACEEDNFTWPRSSDGISIRIGENTTFNSWDIDYYDYSTHLVYLKEGRSFPDSFKGSDRFTVYAGEEEIYSGTLLPGYASYLPEGPVIRVQPAFYQDYIISIGFIDRIDSSGNSLPDPRSDERIESALKNHHQYLGGLECEIISIRQASSGKLSLDLRLSNHDAFDYLFLDPEKMGSDLFHYFTNGLSVRNIKQPLIYSHHIQIAEPEPWNSWNVKWLSLIRGHSTADISLIYDSFDKIPPGNYIADYTFPGLSYQVGREDLVLSSRRKEERIWLGMISASKNFIIRQ